jgi:hypothetical protein
VTSAPLRVRAANRRFHQRGSASRLGEQPLWSGAGGTRSSGTAPTTVKTPHCQAPGTTPAFGEFQYPTSPATHTHPLNASQRRELAGALTPMAFHGPGAGHPWPTPLPATWSVNLADRQPLPYLQVEPTVVAEVELDTATDAAGRPRHLAHHLRTRAKLLPQHIGRWHHQPQT